MLGTFERKGITEVDAFMWSTR